MQRVRNSFGKSGKWKALKSAKNGYALYKFFLEQRENHVLVSGKVIKEKSKLFNRKLKETENFVAGVGWLRRYEIRRFKRWSSIWIRSITQMKAAIITIT